MVSSNSYTYSLYNKISKLLKGKYNYIFIFSCYINSESKSYLKHNKMDKSSATPNDSFTSAMTLTEEGLTCIPKRYIVPSSLRPNGTLSNSNTCLPIVDLSLLQHPLLRPQIIQQVYLACKELGFFQVRKVSSC